ncbi:hypothetical protein PoHVEF18_003335 [Penicillium ochrochloron]
MTYVPHKSKTAGGHESQYDSDSIKQRQNSEKARQNGTHPDVQQDKNKSATACIHETGKDLGDTSRSYPEDITTSRTVEGRKEEVVSGVEQRQTQES